MTDSIADKLLKLIVVIMPVLQSAARFDPIAGVRCVYSLMFLRYLRLTEYNRFRVSSQHSRYVSLYYKIGCATIYLPSR